MFCEWQLFVNSNGEEMDNIMGKSFIAYQSLEDAKIACDERDHCIAVQHRTCGYGYYRHGNYDLCKVGTKKLTSYNGTCIFDKVTGKLSLLILNAISHYLMLVFIIYFRNLWFCTDVFYYTKYDCGEKRL